MKKCLLFVLSLILVLSFSAAPALAGDVRVNVNSDPLNDASLYITNGVTMVNLEEYLRFAGADVQWLSPDQFTITENGQTMQLFINQLTATLDGQSVSLPAAPYRDAKGVSIPLKAVAQSFGYEVNWDGEQSLVTLSRQETRDNMSVQELLAKSGVETQKINTYSMQGAMDITVQLASGGDDMSMGPQRIKSDFYGQLQNDPFKMHTRQVMHPQGNIPELEGMTVEMYMDGSKIYMKLPGQEKWTTMDMPFPADLIKKQQDIQSNPLKAAEQMKEMGMLASFGNDVTIDGQDYYVVNATLDMNKFREGYQKIIDDVVKGLSPEMIQGVDMQVIMQELMKNMQMDYFCTTYINKKTLMSDLVSLDITLDLSLNPSQLGIQDEKSGDQPFKIHEAIKGQIKITDTGKPFAAPDVSAAAPADQMTTPEAKK